jgi:hypothetical protein
MLRLLLPCLMLILILPTRSLASERYIEQMQTIVLLYETLVQNKSPSVSAFLKLFGKGNEAELELILRQEFPSLDLKMNWSDNKEAVDYTEKVFNNPQNYPSRFLRCMKFAEPTLFDGAKWHLQFPPDTTADFRKFTVLIRGKKIIIEFSQDEKTIENVYLADGKSIYNLIEGCKNRIKK